MNISYEQAKQFKEQAREIACMLSDAEIDAVVVAFVEVMLLRERKREAP